MAAVCPDSQDDRDPMMELRRTYTLEAAHYLPCVPDGHKCGRMHGHSYEVTVVVVGAVDARSGWVMDFADIDARVTATIRHLDHRCLNEIMDNPTSENLAMWIYEELVSDDVTAIEVSETARSKVIYRPELSTG